MLSVQLEEKLNQARHILNECTPVVVAFSGGVDSTLVLKLALDTLGLEKVLAVTGVSPSIPPDELAEAEALARKLGARHQFIKTEEIKNENYRSNPMNRCFFCKEELFTRLLDLAGREEFRTVVDGSNADDARDWRPGLEASQALRIRSPLLEANLTKEEVRRAARDLGLPNWKKPAMPCLSSRVPYGEPITVERLQRIDRAERALRELGFKEVRVRDHHPVARIEVPLDDLERLARDPLRSQIVRELRGAGYRFVALDLSGFKSGSLNFLPPS